MIFRRVYISYFWSKTTYEQYEERKQGVEEELQEVMSKSDEAEESATSGEVDEQVPEEKQWEYYDKKECEKWGIVLFRYKSL